ncbi:SH3 domain-containing protein [Leptospira selangorensis]|nr:SH3 domain-containing protein [Leptospira selangorensis]
MKNIILIMLCLWLFDCRKQLASLDYLNEDLKEEVCLNPKNLMIVNAPSGVNIRKEPGIDSEIISTIPIRTIVCKIQTTKINLRTNDGEGVFLKIRYENQEGYILSTYLTALVIENNEFCRLSGMTKTYNPDKTKYFITLSSEVTKVDINSCNDHYGYSCSIIICDIKSNLLFYVPEKSPVFYYIERIENWINNDAILTINDFGDGDDSRIVKGIYSISENIFTWETLIEKNEVFETTPKFLNYANLVACYDQKCYYGKVEKSVFTLYKLEGISSINQFNYYQKQPSVSNVIFSRQRVKSININDNYSGIFFDLNKDKFEIDVKKNQVIKSLND